MINSVVGYRDAWSLMDLYPRATFAVLDRSHHPMPIDKRAPFDSLVNDWLDRIEETAIWGTLDFQLANETFHVTNSPLEC